MARYAESGISSSRVDPYDLFQLFIETREAKSADVGAMARLFIRCFRNDKTARLLYQHDVILPDVFEMLDTYLVDDDTHVRVAWDAYSGDVVGWMSVSLVNSDRGDFFKYCDSTAWVGLQSLHREVEAPVHIDQMRRFDLISRLSEHNGDGQRIHTFPQRLVIRTIAVNPDVAVQEIPEIAYNLINDAREMAKHYDLPLWAQVPENSLGDPEDSFYEMGFDKVGSFEINLNRYASEAHRRQGNWGAQKWTQWVLRRGNWEQGRRW